MRKSCQKYLPCPVMPYLRNLFGANFMERPIWKTCISKRRHLGIEDYSGDLYGQRVFAEIWSILETTNNFSTIWKQRNLSIYGGQTSTGKWMGIMGELVAGRADVAVCDLSQTLLRQRYIDFLSTIYNGRITGFIRRRFREGLRWTDFLHPFQLPLWLAAMGTALLLTLVLVMVLQKGSFSNPVAPRDSWLFVVAAFCQQGQHLPGAWSGRVVCICAHLVALVLAGAHSGSLISALSAGTEPLAFASIRDVLRTPTVRFAVTAQSGVLDKLRDAQFGEFNDLKILLNGSSHRKVEAPYAIEIFEIMCSDYNSIALSGLENKLSLSNLIHCDSEELSFLDIQNPISIGIVKNTGYSDFLSYYVRRMRRVGVVANLLRRHWPYSSTLVEKRYKPSVCLQDVAPLFTVLGIGVLISLLILALELRIHSLPPKH